MPNRVCWTFLNLLAVIAVPLVEGKEPTRTLLTPDACAQCHGVVDGSVSSTNRFGTRDGARLVRLDEFTTWNNQDKHRRSFNALAGPRGREIGSRMGFADVTRERACLTCHGTGFLPADPPPEASGAMDARSQGVGCTACHGPYLEWVQNHGLAGEPVRQWRKLSPIEKRRDFGMTDLRDPVIRASVCLSCHLGDPDDGKVVSHAMYAAGHPPLPGIEVEAFARAMPPHWWEPDEVPAYRQDPSLRLRHGVEPSESRRSKAVLIGGVVAFRESMRLLASEAGKGGPSWPEYARFECYSCHHDLESPGYRGWRQARGTGQRFDGIMLKAKAGHAQIRTWSLALIEPALGSLEESIGVRPPLLEGIKALQATLNHRPFGDPAEVSAVANRLTVASQAMLDALDASRFDRSTALKLLKGLIDLSSGEFPDYDSARQLAWAIRSVEADWQPKPLNHRQIISTIEDLDRLLKLDPYASREARGKLVVGEHPDGDSLRASLLRLSEAEYRASLGSAADYNPLEFKRIMIRLSDLIKGPRPLAPSR